MCSRYLLFNVQVRVDHIKKANTELMNSIRIFLKVVKPYIQFGAFILAFWIALTRVSDYWHHPRDVLTGRHVDDVRRLMEWRYGVYNTWIGCHLAYSL